MTAGLAPGPEWARGGTARSPRGHFKSAPPGAVIRCASADFFRSTQACCIALHIALQNVYFPRLKQRRAATRGHGGRAMGSHRRRPREAVCKLRSPARARAARGPERPPRHLYGAPGAACHRREDEEDEKTTSQSKKSKTDHGDMMRSQATTRAVIAREPCQLPCCAIRRSAPSHPASGR